jgi:pimeloyl-ACP methyl ester carboxylesterase
VIIPYHPGWGDSADAPDLKNVDDYMLHYVKLFDLLALPQINLVGLSMGGRFAATFAIQHPERVKKLVLIAPAGLVVPEHPMPDLSKIPDEIPRYLVEDYSIVEKFLPKRPDPAFLARRDREGGSFMRMAQAGLFAPWLEQSLPKITSPTLLVWGEKDRLVPIGHAAVWNKLIPSSQLLRVPKVGHLPMQEDPKAATAIGDFLAAPAGEPTNTPASTASR